MLAIDSVQLALTELEYSAADCLRLEVSISDPLGIGIAIAEYYNGKGDRKERTRGDTDLARSRRRGARSQRARLSARRPSRAERSG
jgi:hypothetical protein